ncbi:MAG: glycosyltransferase family protein [Verrucomicrobiota bacterium]
MDFIFAVQGEGRGHLTQAITVHDMLTKHGHKVVKIIVGVNMNRKLPDFFVERFSHLIVEIPTLSFAVVKDKNISTIRTGVKFFASIRSFRRSAKELADKLDALEYDMLLNFYEPVSGWAHKLSNKCKGRPIISFGHQFMVEHPKFIRSRKYIVQQRILRILNRYVSSNGHKIALSFYEAEPVEKKRLHVCPPLLRDTVKSSQTATQENFLLVYLLNTGYAKVLEAWHQNNPHVKIHCFVQDPPESQHPNLVYHELNGEKFIAMMRRCKAVLCTAGFESVCEAAYLGKPVYMVPVEKHGEQYLNALDARKAGIAKRGSFSNLGRLLNKNFWPTTESFRIWCESSEEMILEVINEVWQQNQPPA